MRVKTSHWLALSVEEKQKMIGWAMAHSYLLKKIKQTPAAFPGFEG